MAAVTPTKTTVGFCLFALILAGVVFVLTLQSGPALHPVELHRWLHRPNEDLFLGDDVDATVSPLAWLAAGHDPERVVVLAARL